MEKSMEDYRRELIEMASRVAGGRELFAEDSMVENAPQNTMSNSPQTMMPNNTANLTGSGTLVVELTHSKGLFPVVNAKVCVIDMSGRNIGCKQTDSSGKTEEWRLPAPPKANSETPDNPGDVSAFYNIRVDASGYVPVIIEGVPIFDGIRTLQPLDMFFLGAAQSSEPQVIKFNNSYTL